MKRHQITAFISNHKYSLTTITGGAFMIYGNQLMYALLPIFFAGLFNEWKAGLIIGLFNLIQGLLLNPTAGNLADKIGCKPVMLFGPVAAILAGIFWMFIPLASVYTIAIFGLLLFSSYTLRNLTETYLLRTSQKTEGGTIFGLTENAYAVAFFIVTLSIPFFTSFVNSRIPGLLLSSCALIALILTIIIPNDTQHKHLNAKRYISSLNPFLTIKNGWHFIKTNHFYPLMTLANITFESTFYGTIWFVFPIHLLKNQPENLTSGLILGIYEIVTICLAGYIGHMADKHDWKTISKLGWLSIATGVLCLPFYSWPIWLIIVGFIIAFGNNLTAFSALHVLEKYDIDHREDGAFIALKFMWSDTLYAITPAIVGILYFKFGFAISLLLPAIVGIFLAIMTARFAKKLT